MREARRESAAAGKTPIARGTISAISNVRITTAAARDRHVPDTRREAIGEARRELRGRAIVGDEDDRVGLLPRGAREPVVEVVARRAVAADGRLAPERRGELRADRSSADRPDRASTGGVAGARAADDLAGRDRGRGHP